jgi:hypothetical protein
MLVFVTLSDSEINEVEFVYVLVADQYVLQFQIIVDISDLVELSQRFNLIACKFGEYSMSLLTT